MNEKKLLMLIQQYPEIYNSSHEDFRKKEKWNSAWQVISQEMKIDASHLLKKWRHIRASLLKDFINPNKKTRYYLRDHLDFYLPYMRSTKLRNNPYKIDNNEYGIEINVESSTKETSGDDESCETLGNTSTSTLAEASISAVNPGNLETKQIEQEFISHPIEHYIEGEIDYEKSFLLSLFPDFKTLDAKRKRKFRAKATQILSDLHEEMTAELIDENIKETDPLMLITSSGGKNII